MITGVHALLFSRDAAAVRGFFRDVLGFSSVDAGDGWLIFALPPAELGVHPAGDEAPSGTHQLLLMCRDLEQMVADLKQRGAEFADEISDEGFGRLINLKVPGADVIGLYEPKHASPLAKFG